MIRGKSPRTKSSSRGFTVVEIATVMLLSSLILAGSLGLIRSWMSKTGTVASQQRLATIQQSLTNFQAQYNRIPCPAPFVALGGAGFGRESCGSTIGALPVRDLGLSDSYSANTSGFMYIYSATASETAKLDGLKGTINVVDGSGNSVLPTYVNAAGATITVGATYVVVDPGVDGKGVHLLSSGLIVKPCAGPGLDVPNCNGAGTFVSAQFSTQAATWYDDSIIYDTGPPKGTIPQVCTTVISAASATGTSGGWSEGGPDLGVGFTVVPFGGGPFVFWYIDQFTLSVILSGYNTTSPPADAYCKYTNQYVQSGGCTNLKGGVPYGLDVAQGSNEQTVLPPLSHPALPDATGKQGWECNGPSASGISTRAYAICCWGG